ncbi:MAG TPA: protein kinase [Anaeromyxobacteraceae bacterium]|nr:protein kinase [Anaeromyxobacteraceae bacterium]
MSYMVGGRVRRLGSYPGREAEGLGLFYEAGSAPRVARLIELPGVEPGAREGLLRHLARSADALHHPHIQSTLGLDEGDGRLSIAVDHADGETLAEILAVGGRLPPEVAARILRDACEAIHFAHEDGMESGPIVHGWLRPAHLLVARSGVTLVAGFGAGHSRSAADLVPWQSPEQILGGPGAASRASDVHGLGLVLHAALAGENPFEREPDPDVAMLSRAAPLLEPLGVPPALGAVVRRALAVKASDRFSSAAAMARAIEEAVPDMAAPSAVAAWSESLFPAGMGMRVLRQRAFDAAVAAAARADAPPPETRSRPVPLPAPGEPRAVPEARASRPAPELRPPPRLRFRPAPARTQTEPGPVFSRPGASTLPPLPEVEPAPRTAARPPVRPVAARPAAARPVAPRAEADEPAVEFSLAAPPFPQSTRSRDPLEAIEVDVVLPDPPPPLRLPVQQRVTAGGSAAIGRIDVQASARTVAAGVAALAMTQLKPWS